LALMVDSSLSIVRALERLAEFRGLPLMIVSDSGTELTSPAILSWQEECLNEYLFGSLKEARHIIEEDRLQHRPAAYESQQHHPNQPVPNGPEPEQALLMNEDNQGAGAASTRSESPRWGIVP
jgi:hypothetical protein